MMARIDNLLLFCSKQIAYGFIYLGLGGKDLLVATLIITSGAMAKGLDPSDKIANFIFFAVVGYIVFYREMLGLADRPACRLEEVSLRMQSLLLLFSPVFRIGSWIGLTLLITAASAIGYDRVTIPHFIRAFLMTLVFNPVWGVYLFIAYIRWHPGHLFFDELTAPNLTLTEFKSRR